MHRPNHCEENLAVARIFRSRQHHLRCQDRSNLATFSKNSTKSRDASFFGNSIGGVGCIVACCLAHLFHDVILAIAVVNDNVPLALVEERLHVWNSIPGNGDDRMDVRKTGKLDCVRALYY